MKELSNATKAIGFTIIVMILASIMGLVLNLPGQVYMFAPLIAVLILLLVTGELFKRKSWTDLGITKTGWKSWGFAIFMPIIVLASSYVVLWMTPYASITVPEGTTTVMWLMIPAKLLLVAAVYTVTSSIGEEIGWRGYLLHHLADMGWRKALLIIGAIHGVFHFPIMLAGNYHSEGNPWLVVPMFMLTIIFIGVVLGASRLITGSVWPAAIMHAVHNIIWGALSEFTQIDSEFAHYIGGENGVVAIGLYGLLAFWILKNGKNLKISEDRPTINQF